MSYTPTEWKDHIVERPNRFRIQDNGDGTVDILDEHGNIIQQGTPVNAANLNKMEQGIKEAHDNIGETEDLETDDKSNLVAAINEERQKRIAHLAEKASKTEYGHVQVGDDLNVNNGVISVDKQSVRTDTNTPLRVEVVSSSVSETPDAGRIIFDTSQGKFFGGNGTEWV